VQGNHALCCRKQRGRHARHTMCNDIIQRALQGIDVPSALEPSGLSRTDGKRPDGVTLIPWTRGRSAIWDFTCAHRLAASHYRLAGDAGASVAAHKETLKCGKYDELASKNNLIFHPISCETLGGFGPQSRDFIRQLSDRAVKKTGEKCFAISLRQRLGIAIQVGNAISIQQSLLKTAEPPDF